MKIAIVAPAPVPAVFGGAERLWRGLHEGLSRRGHQVELLTRRFPETNLQEILDGYEYFANLDVSRFDLVISGKYPAWMITHPRHVIYLLHPLRGLYDTYPPHLGQLADSVGGRELLSKLDSCSNQQEIIACGRSILSELAKDDALLSHPGPLARELVHRLDAVAMAPNRVAAFAAISEEVAGRADYLPSDRPVLVSHPESDLPVGLSLSEAESEGPVFFTASRLDRPKRIELMIEAFHLLTNQRASLLIAGDGPDRARLERFVGTNHRIQFLGRIPESDLVARYHQATAILFVPHREDFGYITLEAIRSGTPVITTTDSGGARELLETNVGGIVVEPNPPAIAAAMRALADNPLQRWILGLNGQRRAQRANWSELWRIIEDLDPAQSTDRPKVLSLSTFAIDPTIGGGQRRVRHLTRELARHADVTVLTLSGSGRLRGSGAPAIKRRVLELGLTEVVVPRSPQHRNAEAEITRVAGLPVDDITCAALWEANPAFIDELEAQLANADVVVVSHPFLAPALRHRLGDTPLIYDSHNAEAQFKATVLNRESSGRWLLELTTEAERLASLVAVSVTACTQADVSALQQLAPESEATFTVIPNGVDTLALPRRQIDRVPTAKAELLALAGVTDPSEHDRPVAVFVGSWHPPNLDAARLILEAAAQCPGWTFVLAGSHTISLDAGNQANIYLIPTFAEESLYPLIAGADVALNPMVSGGGSNLKLYDYLAVGVPVLTTEIGARGLANPDQIVWTCDQTSESIARGLDHIHRHPNQARNRSDAGRALVEKQMDWRGLGQLWSKVVLGPDSDLPEARKPRPDPPEMIVASAPPPSPDPTIELMTRITNTALRPQPPKDIASMDPTLRENLRRMATNKMAGQELPVSARLKPIKRALIRAGKIVTNEQVVFNEATVDAVQALSEQVQELSNQIDQLGARIPASETSGDTSRS